MISLRPMVAGEVPFVLECLRELRGGARYDEAELEAYLTRWGLMDGVDGPILVAREDERPVGMLTCNRFAMPRYLGFGIEIEEVVVHPSEQGRGIAGQMIDTFLSSLEGQPELRRVLVKTDDLARAGRVYARRFEVIATTVYGRGMHRL